ncbi:MAG: ATP-binding protein [Terriglobia bacterium]
MGRLSLTSRAFLFSVLPVCLALGASFLALHAAVHQSIRKELRESLQASNSLLNRASAEYGQRTTRLIAKLTDSAGLKAAVGLLLEVHDDPSVAAQVRRTIEVQLRELQASSAYDFLAISNLHGQPIAALVFPQGREVASIPDLPLGQGLEEIEGVLYELQTVPVEIAGEPQAVLTLGSRFELNRLALAGDAVLLHGDHVIRSTFSPAWKGSLEEQIRRACPPCECRVRSVDRWQTFVVSQLERAQLGGGYRLLGFRSLDAALREFNSAFLRILVEVGAAGVFVALLCTLATSYSVSQPLRDLVAQLRRSESMGGLPERLTVGNGVRELDSLAGVFNRVADAERRSRRDLEISRDAAESANRLKTEFLTNISHELRTPMNGVLGMTDVLLGTKLYCEQEEYATLVLQSAQSLQTIIDDILDFSELETGKLRLQPRLFDLDRLLTEFAADLGKPAAAKDIAVELLYSPSAPREFFGDATRIRQVLMYLGENAVKFTERGQIRVSCACTHEDERGAAMKLAIEDTGIGIAAEMRELIFQKFTQADDSLTRRRGGTGLSLAVAKEMVELMGGEMGVESQVNVGSTFWFTITLPKPEPAAQPNAVLAGEV